MQQSRRQGGLVTTKPTKKWSFCHRPAKLPISETSRDRETFRMNTPFARMSHKHCTDGQQQRIRSHNTLPTLQDVIRLYSDKPRHQRQLLEKRAFCGGPRRFRRPFAHPPCRPCPCNGGCCSSLGAVRKTARKPQKRRTPRPRRRIPQRRLQPQAQRTPHTRRTASMPAYSSLRPPF